MPIYKKSDVEEHEFILSATELIRIKEILELNYKLSEKSQKTLSDILEKTDISDADFIFNSSYQPNHLRIFQPDSKISKNCEYLKIKNNLEISKNFILFFLTRSDYKELINLKKQGSIGFKTLKLQDFLAIPVPKTKVKKKLIINSESLAIILKELLLAEQNQMYFSCCVLSGTIIEFVLLEIVEELKLPEVVMKKFNMIEGLKLLVRECKEIQTNDIDFILPRAQTIQENRNYIHANKNNSLDILKIKEKAQESIQLIEKIILHFGL